MWRDLFYFQQSDRRIIGLLSLILLVLLLLYGYQQSQRASTPQPLSEAQQEEFDTFFAHLAEKEEAAHYQLVHFDPNRADSTTLSRLGLTAWQIKAINNYRAKGGRYRKPEDFKRLYGLSQAHYQRLAPYIQIEPLPRELSREKREQKVVLKAKEQTLSTDCLKTAYPLRRDKFTELTLVELNSADTTLLKKIPGIGSGFAHAIVRRRQQLGGFVDLLQLSEINHFPDSLHRWFTIDQSKITTLEINSLSLEQLRKHPYLSFYQASDIVTHRKRYGKLTTLNQLSLYESFSEADLARLAPYIAF